MNYLYFFYIGNIIRVNSTKLKIIDRGGLSKVKYRRVFIIVVSIPVERISDSLNQSMLAGGFALTTQRIL